MIRVTTLYASTAATSLALLGPAEGVFTKNGRAKQ